MKNHIPAKNKLTIFELPITNKSVSMLTLIQFTIAAIMFLSNINGVVQDKTKSAATSSDKYQCVPCGYDCDKVMFDAPGACPQCKMPLVKVSTIHFNTIQPSEVCNYIKQHPNVVLLDVRTKEEFEGKANPDFGTLKNAMNIPIQQLATRLSEINNLKDKDIIVFCSHSHRSPQASYLLTQNGFNKVINMAGGMSVMKDKACIK